METFTKWPTSDLILFILILFPQNINIILKFVLNI